MSDNSHIEWTDATWNPTTGCTKVSPGCDHCYAEGIFNRFNGPGAFDTVTLRPERLGQPLRWRKPRLIFVNSMSDLFHDDVPEDYIAHVFAVMALSPRHTFQVLTKRHGRMRSLLNDDDFRGLVSGYIVAYTVEDGVDDSHLTWPECDVDWWPLRNVWLGVSVEDQKWADIRVPALIETPAAVRFLSCEPLLGPIRLERDWTELELQAFGGLGGACFPRVDWVIVGAESGRGSRPMDEQWARSLKDQCVEAAVPFFLKQYAVNGRKVHLPQLDGQQWTEYPAMAVAS